MELRPYQRDAVDAVEARLKLVVAQLVPHKKDNQKTTGKPRREANDVDEGEYFLAPQVPPGDFQIVLDHDYVWVGVFFFLCGKGAKSMGQRGKGKGYFASAGGTLHFER